MRVVDAPHDERLAVRLDDVAAADVQPDRGGGRLRVQQDGGSDRDDRDTENAEQSFHDLP
jgi:hypothetical protein